MNRLSACHFRKALVTTVPTVYDTCMVMKIFTIGLPAECVMSLSAPGQCWALNENSSQAMVCLVCAGYKDSQSVWAGKDLVSA